MSRLACRRRSIGRAWKIAARARIKGISAEVQRDARFFVRGFRPLAAVQGFLAEARRFVRCLRGGIVRIERILHSRDCGVNLREFWAFL